MCALVALGLLISLLGTGADSDAGAAPSLSIHGVFPAFDAAESRYVSRCGRGGADPIRARAGSGTRLTVGGKRVAEGEMRVESPAGPGEDFRVTAVSDGGERRDYRVRCLPADFPRWRFESLLPAAPGFFAVAFRESKDDRPWVIVFDQDGVPRWWFSPDTRALWAQVLADGTVSIARSFGDGYGVDPRMAQEIRSLSGQTLRVVRTKGTIIDGHEFQQTGDGDFLADSYDPGGHVDLRRFGGPARASAVFAEVQELDPSGRVRWSWNSRGKIGLPETGRWWRNVLSNAKRGRGGATTFDPFHVNSIEPRGPDEIVVSMRHTDAVYGISRASGDVLWKLGGTETGRSLEIDGDPARKLFGGQHDVRIDDGILSIFDNGKDRPRRPRVAFYRLETEDGRAVYQGQLNDTRVTASHCCGSARPFGEGWLVSWGDNPLVTGFDAADRIAFRLELPVSTYRAVPAPEGAVGEAALDRGLEAMEAGPAG